jgi:hypothetical protein
MRKSILNNAISMQYRAYNNVVLLKESKPSKIGLKWGKSFEKSFNALSGFCAIGLIQTIDATYMMQRHGFIWGLVLLKDLPKTTNTVSAFSCPNQNNDG